MITGECNGDTSDAMICTTNKTVCRTHFSFSNFRAPPSHPSMPSLGSKMSSGTNSRLQPHRRIDHLRQTWKEPLMTKMGLWDDSRPPICWGHLFHIHQISSGLLSEWFSSRDSCTAAFSRLIFLVHRPYLASRGRSCQWCLSRWKYHGYIMVYTWKFRGYPMDIQWISNGDHDHLIAHVH